MMNLFLNEDFLLTGETAKHLYHDLAKGLPIVDYHCHIDAREIAENRLFSNPTQLWLSGDHYKWRLMRANGIPEVYITGKYDEYGKFEKWAQTLEKAAGNPLFIWSHMELKKYFGYDGYLNGSNAKKVWDYCVCAMGQGIGVRRLLQESDVRLLCTTDDPVSALEWHKKILADSSIQTKVLPTFRPDKALDIEKDSFCEYIHALGLSAGIKIENIAQLQEALALRMDFFERHGCLISDHALADYFHSPAPETRVNKIFLSRLAGETVSKAECDQYKTGLLVFLAESYAKRKWAMQLHLGVNRNVNRRQFEALGPDTGFDCMRGGFSYPELVKLLDELETGGNLPKTVLYSIDPKDNAIIDSIANCFSAPEVTSKVQHGAAWWFNDHTAGIKEHLGSLANMNLLGAFIGMLTDSRSFLSYVRHDYFRRVLCDFIGSLVDSGEYPKDAAMLEALIKDISYRNSISYFGFDL